MVEVKGASWPEFYAELRSIATAMLASERVGHTLQPTALLHEAYLRITEFRNGWDSDTEFRAAVATTLRRVLIDYAKQHKALKRGGNARRVPLDTSIIFGSSKDLDIVELSDALSQLSEHAPRMGQVVELRFFGGFTEDEIALTLGVSKRTVQLDWKAARIWLHETLTKTG